jgi:hypothetical protein
MREKSDYDLGDDPLDEADTAAQSRRRGRNPLFDSVVMLHGPNGGKLPKNIGAPGDSDYAGLSAAVGDVVMMTENQRRARDTFDWDRAQRIAEEYSEGAVSLKDLHTSDLVNIPPPLVIRRWRRESPEFDAMMVDAKRVKAESMMEETIKLADSPDYNVAKNQISARRDIAKAYDRDQFGETQTLLGDRNRPLMVGASAAAGLSEAELVEIASRGRITGPGKKTTVAPELVGPVAETEKPAT